MSRTRTYYAADGEELQYGGACGPAAYFERSQGLPAGPFIRGLGYVHGYRPDGSKDVVYRVVDYKAKNPSLHKCDGRCRNAKGHNCECECGGKNHGIDNC